MADERARVETVEGFLVPIADQPTGWEIWETWRDDRVCPICKPLQGLILAVGFGLQPPRHEGCRCRRLPVDLSVLSPAQLIRLDLEKRRRELVVPEELDHYVQPWQRGK